MAHVNICISFGDFDIGSNIYVPGRTAARIKLIAVVHVACVLYYGRPTCGSGQTQQN